MQFCNGSVYHTATRDVLHGPPPQDQSRMEVNITFILLRVLMLAFPL